ncbi:MAG TPA: hemolysin III family protein [Solirubrobacterales bacterium]|nr:hemolysin III family protein [Solirubrobacterales bacterium]
MEDLRRGAERMGERASAAREEMADRAAAAKDAMGDRAQAAKEAVGERATAAKEATAEAIALVKPKLRGVSHKWAFFASLVLGVALIVWAETPKATFAVAVYAVSLSALFGTSALYHGVEWSRPNLRLWMRRLDHSMIFFLIAGTYTPFALLVLHGTIAQAILAVVWIGAVAGAIVEMVWINHPKWASALIYLSLGWVAVAAFPELWTSLGVAGTMLVAFGGLLYTAGAVVYATQRPNPNPAVFGYHEVFHLFVIAAAIAQYAAIAFFALPHA